MVLNSDLQYNQDAIVWVKCNDMIGTAFFIDEHTLLTARHVVCDYDDEHRAYVYVGKEFYECDVELEESDIDLAILRCSEYCCKESLHMIKVEYKYGSQYRISGYPTEHSTVMELYTKTVVAVGERKDLALGYDVSLNVTAEGVSFNNYSGFSGSPVINAFGSVVGIVTTQYYNNLGYTSVNIASNYLTNHNIEFDVNGYKEDTSAYGMGTGILLVDRATKKAGNRFSIEFDYDNDSMEKIEVINFSGIRSVELKETLAREFDEWLSLPNIQKQKKTILWNTAIKDYSLNHIYSENFFKELEKLKIEEEDIKIPLPSQERNTTSLDLITTCWSINSALSDEKYQWLLIKGTAGVGKTHRVSTIAKVISQKMNTYLFFGYDFIASDDIETNIKRLLSWRDEQSLVGLDQQLGFHGNAYAIFIIDGVNEGVGTKYWTENIPEFYKKVVNLKHLKFIISVREHSETTELDKIFYRLNPLIAEMKEFPDRDKAVGAFFDNYKIDLKPADFSYHKEFGNALFLRLFCEAYASGTFGTDIIYSNHRFDIYLYHISTYEEELSRRIDVDQHEYPVTHYLYEIAKKSLEIQCADITRKEAKRLAEKIVPNRPWSRNILNLLLESFLLREYTVYHMNDEFVDFEFDQMGDYLRMRSILLENKTYGKQLNVVKKLVSKLDTTDFKVKNRLIEVIRIFFRVWNPDEKHKSLWFDNAIIQGNLTKFVIDSLVYRNFNPNMPNTLDGTVIQKLFSSNKEYLSPIILFQNLDGKTLLFFYDFIDETLRHMKMNERDLKWSTQVNELYYYNLPYFIKHLPQKTEDEREKLILFLPWLFTASFPYVRWVVLRKMVKLLYSHKDMCVSVIRKFYRIDDFYVMHGILASIYGALVLTSDKDIANKVSSEIIELMLDKDDNLPLDAVSRCWIYKIFDWTDHLAGTTFLVDYSPKRKESDFRLMTAPENLDDKFFGEVLGSRKLFYSLTSGDFNRYELGANTREIYGNFFYSDKTGISIDDIEYNIAFIIKNDYKWNDQLADYDTNITSIGRFDSPIERIGKKYQWLALSKVQAQLLDYTLVAKDVYHSPLEFYEINYPWLGVKNVYLDPTLISPLPLYGIVKEIFDPYPHTNLLDKEEKDWLEDDSNMEVHDIIQEDKKNKEWVVLFAYIKEDANDSEGKNRERFIFYNTSLVTNESESNFREWATNKNFYGRFMPEANGSIDFLWNEFPWGKACEGHMYEEAETAYDLPCDVYLPYDAQMQEDSSGFPDNYMYLSTVYMPCADMMRFLELHTAERGVIRSKDNQIVAINRSMENDVMKGLVIRRDSLNNYLRHKNMTLFYNILGEKVVKEKKEITQSWDMKRYTGASEYRPSDNPLDIQPMRKEPTK